MKSNLFCSMLLAIGFAVPGLVHAEEGNRLPQGKGTVTLVDGVEMQAEVLFEHPNAPLLVVRSVGGGTLQSIRLDVIHAVSVDGASKTLNPRRKLTKAESHRREVNGLWGDQAESGRIGNYARESWAKRPVAVWAQPGKSGNALASASWLDEKGQPWKDGPWKIDNNVRDKLGRKKPDTGQFDGDILLPQADTQYRALQAGSRDYLGIFTLRHLTIEANASYNVRYTIQGNAWLKDGSDLGDGTQTGGLGSHELDKHTFIRFCGKRWPEKRHAKDGDSFHIPISHWVWIDTGKSGTLEVIGRSAGPGDRVNLKRGTFIVSENSYFGNGPRASFYNEPETTVILLNGAGIGCSDRVTRNARATYAIGGKLMFGTPKHPLTRDLRFEGGLMEVDQLDAIQTATRGQGASIILGETGSMEIHSADPTKARVVFCQTPEDRGYSSYAVGKRAGGREMPKGITAAFLGKTSFNGVVFDGFQPGGIVVDPEARKQWKNVSFGPNNLAEPDKLFRKP